MRSQKKKILTILGTRPEIIRLSRIIPKLDIHFENIIVHTGQNYDYELDRIFLKELNVRRPNYYLNARGTFAKQIAIILVKLEQILKKEKPDKFLVLGDTNSSVGAIVAKRLNIKVFHMEAGNRCYSDKSPEEINRRIIDHSSNILLPYTKGSRLNLLKEGISSKKIITTGNPIKEVIHFNIKKINNSKIIHKLKLKNYKFIVLTLHREENADNIKKLGKFINIFNTIVNTFNLKIVWPVHPRTRKELMKNKIEIDKNIILLKPLGFIDFIKLEKKCVATITDSGTVQEESALFKIPCAVIREYTERPETIKAGSATLTNYNKEKIMKLISLAVKKKYKIKKIKDYESIKVSSKVLNLIKKY